MQHIAYLKAWLKNYASVKKIKLLFPINANSFTSSEIHFHYEYVKNHKYNSSFYVIYGHIFTYKISFKSYKTVKSFKI